LGKIIKIVATRGQISRLKCTKYYFSWFFAPDDPAGEDYSARPEPLAGRGPTSKGDGREGRKKEDD